MAHVEKVVEFGSSTLNNPQSISFKESFKIKPGARYPFLIPRSHLRYIQIVGNSSLDPL